MVYRTEYIINLLLLLGYWTRNQMAQGQPQLDLVTTAQPRRQAEAKVRPWLVLGILQPRWNAVCSLIWCWTALRHLNTQRCFTTGRSCCQVPSFILSSLEHLYCTCRCTSKPCETAANNTKNNLCTENRTGKWLKIIKPLQLIGWRSKFESIMPHSLFETKENIHEW